MFRQSVAALSLGVALVVAGPASADQCYSPAQTRAMVQSQGLVSLSGVLGKIKAIGQLVSTDALLCDVGGTLVYLIDVIADGNVIHIQVDARTGAITY